MKHVQLVITGSRDSEWDYEQFENAILDKYEPKDIARMVFGEARGIDTFAKEFCIKHEIFSFMFKADWDNKGKKAGINRNEYMAKFALSKSHRYIETTVLAFRTNLSRGTTHMIKFSQDLGLNVVVHDKSSFTFE